MNFLILFTHPMQLFLNVIIAWIEGQVDGATVLRGRWPEHKISATIRVVVNALFIWFVNHKLLKYSYYECSLTLIASLALYWMFLDLSINIKRGKEIFYIGKTAKTDKVINAISAWMNKKNPGTGIDGEHIFLFKLIIAFLSISIHYSL